MCTCYMSGIVEPQNYNSGQIKIHPCSECTFTSNLIEEEDSFLSFLTQNCKLHNQAILDSNQ